MRAIFAVVILWLLQGCAAQVVQTVDQARLFNDKLFAPPTERIDAADVFQVSPAMRHYVRVEIARQLEDKGRQQGLVDALYRPGQLQLQYDAEITRNAVQAFEARSGNCLSLVILTAALARELGLAVHYRRVFSDHTWSRVGELQVASTHVNVILGNRQNDPRLLLRDRGRDEITIDFIPAAPGRTYRGYAISEATVTAMFMNNRAAEAMAAGRGDDAYWWARAAVMQDPQFLAAYNTLGVVYHRRGHLAEAERVLAFVVAREPNNTFALSNQALVLQGLGRSAEAHALSQRLARIEPHPPFQFFDRGRVAMKAGDYAAARELFEQEVARDADYHEFHYWLAAAHLALGEVPAAKRHMAIALKNSTNRGERDLYAAKLERIK